jgi:hypothetical protein
MTVEISAKYCAQEIYNRILNNKIDIFIFRILTVVYIYLTHYQFMMNNIRMKNVTALKRICVYMQYHLLSVSIEMQNVKNYLE